MAETVHKKGRHRSRRFKMFKASYLIRTVSFDSSCRYYLNGGDQKDWNKLFGLKRRFFFPQRDSVMIAWRYNDKTDKIELSPYLHRKGETNYNYLIQEIEIGQEIEVRIDLDLGFKINGLIYNIHSDFKRGWYINSWFGGNRKAPHDIRIMIR